MPISRIVFGQHRVDALSPVGERRWVGRVSVALQLHVPNYRSQCASPACPVEVRTQELAHRSEALTRRKRNIIQLTQELAHRSEALTRRKRNIIQLTQDYRPLDMTHLAPSRGTGPG